MTCLFFDKFRLYLGIAFCICITIVVFALIHWAVFGDWYGDLLFKWPEYYIMIIVNYIMVACLFAWNLNFNDTTRTKLEEWSRKPVTEEKDFPQLLE